MWKCSCGHIILGNSEWCPAALTHHKETHVQVSSNSPDWLQALLATSELKMTPQEELFAKFYNEEKVLVKDMDHITLREHREQLQQIAFEAKAKVVAADDELRERKAKTNKKDWLVTDTTQPPVSDLINVVKVRQARMSKADKLAQQLRSINMDEATIKEMVAKIEQKATNSTMKTVTFNAPTIKPKSIQVSSKKNGEDKKPFDPSTLKFGK